MNTIETLRCLVDTQFFLTQAVQAIWEQAEEKLPVFAGLPVLKGPPPLAEFSEHRVPRFVEPLPDNILRPRFPSPPSGSPQPGIGAGVIIVSLAFFCTRHLSTLLSERESEDRFSAGMVWHPGWLKKDLLSLERLLNEAKRICYSRYLQDLGYFAIHANRLAGLDDSGKLRGQSPGIQSAYPGLTAMASGGTQGASVPLHAQLDPQSDPMIVDRQRIPRGGLDLETLHGGRISLTPPRGASRRLPSFQETFAVWKTDEGWTTIAGTITPSDPLYDGAAALREMHAAQHGSNPLSLDLASVRLHLAITAQEESQQQAPQLSTQGPLAATPQQTPSITPQAPSILPRPPTAFAVSVSETGAWIVGPMPDHYRLALRRGGSPTPTEIHDPRIAASPAVIGLSRGAGSPFASIVPVVEDRPVPALRPGDELIVTTPSGTQIRHQQQGPRDPATPFPTSLGGQVGAGELIQEPNRLVSLRLPHGDVAIGTTQSLRRRQQDAALGDPALGLVGIGDGLGGLAQGGWASSTGLQEIRNHLQVARVRHGALSPSHLEEAMQAANRRIRAGLPPQERGGTTAMVIVMGEGDRPFGAFVGDGTFMICRQSPTGRYRPIAIVPPNRRSNDHNHFVGTYGHPPRSPIEEASALHSNILLAALGLNDAPLVVVDDSNDAVGPNRVLVSYLDKLRRPDGRPLGPLQSGDRFIAWTDGLDGLPEEVILRSLDESATPALAYGRIIDGVSHRQAIIHPYMGRLEGERHRFELADDPDEPWLHGRFVSGHGNFYEIPGGIDPHGLSERELMAWLAGHVSIDNTTIAIGQYEGP